MLKKKGLFFLKYCPLACGLMCTAAWANPHGINKGYWALHVPFDLEPVEAMDGRSLGMGNAAAAIADETSAAVINPAGLLAVQGIEVTGSLGMSSYDIDYIDTYASLNNIGLGPDMNEIRTFSDDVTNLPFFGVTIPILPEQLVTAVYYQNTGFTGADSQTVGPLPVLDESLNIQQQSMSEKNIEEYDRSVYGLAGAFRVNDMFSIGASVNMETFDADLYERWRSNTFSNYILDSATGYENRIQGDDTDLTFGLGAQVELDTGLSVGLAYRQGGSFSIDYSSTENNCSASGHCTANTETDTAAFDVPDVWSIGAAWRPAQDWLLSVQTDLVEYSVLSDSTTQGITTDEEIEDGVVLRFGAEKTFFISNILEYQLRAGLFTEPDHDGFEAIDSDKIYYTLGGGFTWNQQIKVNLGTGFSEDVFNGVLTLSCSI
ncbi:MAG: OmpP1/FadL family transporter [Candidatus Electrothrix sp. YB6]